MPGCPPVDLARSLATVLQICIRHKDKLNQFTAEQVGQFITDLMIFIFNE